MRDIAELLRGNTYPGRGIIIGRSGDGKRMIAVYFIMGRSENSRNRVFEATDDGIRTRAYDPALLSDPSLVIYNPVRVFEGGFIVTNGVQTDTILEFIKDGRDFRSALYEWEFEPDPPIYTPRISGIIERGGGYRLSILKPEDGDPGSCRRCFFEYSKPLAGRGHFISTYESDGSPPPSFAGEPITVNTAANDGLESFAKSIWNALNADNRVSLYAREMDITADGVHQIIINKHGGDAACVSKH